MMTELAPVIAFKGQLYATPRDAKHDVRIGAESAPDAHLCVPSEESLALVVELNTIQKDDT